MSLIKQIKSDPNFTKFNRIFEGIKKQVNIETSLNEALSLHASRTSRDITGEKRYNPKIIIDASLKDLSYRARLVEIRVKNDLQLSILKEAIDAMKRHVQTEYAEDLREFSTADQRRAFADRVVKSAKEFLAEGESFMDILDTLIRDIDQAGFTIKHIIECMKLLQGAKGTTVV